METNSDLITPHSTNNPMPSTKGTYSILPNGSIIGYPDSSAVAFWCFTSRGTFSVRFRGTDRMYVYEGVHFSEVTRLMTADSVGEFINKVIKPNHPAWTY